MHVVVSSQCTRLNLLPTIRKSFKKQKSLYKASIKHSTNYRRSNHVQPLLVGYICWMCHFAGLSASSDAELQQVFKSEEHEALLLETGFSKPPSSLKLSDQDMIRASLLDYHCLVKVKAPMDQFKDQVGLGKFLN